MKDFVEYYRSLYSSNNEELQKNILGRKIGCVEEDVEKIAKNTIDLEAPPETLCSEITWKHIAWKAGKLKYKAEGFSKGDMLFVDGKYAWDGKRIDGVFIGRKRNETGLSESERKDRIDKFISSINEYYKTCLSKDISFKSAYEKCLELNTDCYNIGTVYTITLIYFLSKGSLPIYDKFAHKAAKAVYLGVSPSEVFVGEAPGKTETQKIYNMYNEYCWLLKQIFGQEKISRKQDQALWVYGHIKDCEYKYKGKIILPKLSDKAKKYKMLIN